MKNAWLAAVLSLSGCVAAPSLLEVDPDGTIVAAVEVLAPPERYAVAGRALEAAGLISYRTVDLAEAHLACGGSGACSRGRLDGSCFITISTHYAPDIAAALIEHERAHCAGWPAYHPA